MSFSEEISQYIRQKHYRQINSVLFWQDGRILAENYYNGFTAQSRNVLRSVVKSTLSLAVGVALEHGLLPGLDVAVADYLPPFREGRDPLHPLITVRHLLTMTSGIYWSGGVHAMNFPKEVGFRKVHCGVWGRKRTMMYEKVISARLHREWECHPLNSLTMMTMPSA